MRHARLIAGTLLAILFLAACGMLEEPIEDGQGGPTGPAPTKPAEDDPRFPEGTFLDIFSPLFVAGGGEVDVEYDFTIAAVRVPDGVTSVTFTWDFGDGTSGGPEAVAVVDGYAKVERSHAFARAGSFVVSAEVSETGGAELTSNSRVAIIDQEPDEREVVIGSCEGWSVSDSGGVGTTVDTWDLSEVPEGTVIDMRYKTYTLLDRIMVEYPVGYVVHDTGFTRTGGRPGDGDPYRDVDGLFTKAAGNSLRVTVIGRDAWTQWLYEFRCQDASN